jgi:superkiller protein 3
LFTPAIARVRQAVKVLESRYETAESTEVEKEYAVALVNLGRLQLAEGENDTAVATLTDCIGLCSERTDDEGLAILVQCHLVIALSLSNRERTDDALESFQKSLDMADKLSVASKRDVCREKISVLLARTLWHTGSDDAREAAKTNLLEA